MVNNMNLRVGTDAWWAKTSKENIYEAILHLVFQHDSTPAKAMEIIRALHGGEDMPDAPWEDVPWDWNSEDQ
jgi:hypothetical protein